MRAARGCRFTPGHTRALAVLLASLVIQPATAGQDPIVRAALKAQSRRSRINGIDLNNYVEVGAAPPLGFATRLRATASTPLARSRCSHPCCTVYRCLTTHDSLGHPARSQVEDALIDAEMAAEGFPPPPERDEWTEHWISERKATGG
jgi:hypothetical protein